MPEYDDPAVHEMLRALPHGTPPVYPDGCDGVVDNRWLSVAVIAAYNASNKRFDENHIGDHVTIRGVVADRSRRGGVAEFVFVGNQDLDYPTIRCLMPDIASMDGVEDGKEVTVAGQLARVQRTQGGNGPVEIIFTAHQVVWS